MKIVTLLTVIFCCMSSSLYTMETSRKTFAQEWKMVDKGKKILDSLQYSSSGSESDYYDSSDSESDEGYGRRKTVSRRQAERNKALDLFERAREIALQRNADNDKVRAGNGLAVLCSEIEKQKRRI
jgi:hypothetical protein